MVVGIVWFRDRNIHKPVNDSINESINQSIKPLTDRLISSKNFDMLLNKTDPMKTHGKSVKRMSNEQDQTCAITSVNGVHTVLYCVHSRRYCYYTIYIP